jgi:hypothetical protein
MEDNIESYHRVISCEDVKWIELAEDSDDSDKPSGAITTRNFFY